MTPLISSANRRIRRILSILPICLCIIPEEASSQEITGIEKTATQQAHDGAEMVFTGLWKIDKHATTILTEGFHKKLLEGLPRNKALLQAKLEYLKKAKAKMLGPQYWAGLVLIGDNSPLHIGNKSFFTNWIIFGSLFLICFLGMGIYWRQRFGAWQ